MIFYYSSPNGLGQTTPKQQPEWSLENPNHIIKINQEFSQGCICFAFLSLSLLSNSSPTIFLLFQPTLATMVFLHWLLIFTLAIPWAWSIITQELRAHFFPLLELYSNGNLFSETLSLATSSISLYLVLWFISSITHFKIIVFIYWCSFLISIFLQWHVSSFGARTLPIFFTSTVYTAWHMVHTQ